MTCKAFILSFFLSLLSMVNLTVAYAQGENSYGMDDECYKYYLVASDAVGTPEFSVANQEFYNVLSAKGDKAAEIQYLVLKLRHLGRGSSVQQVLDAADELKRKAIEYDSDKYYFYAYSRAALYLTDNEPQEEHVVRLINEMLSEAKAKGSDYGIYEANRYLSLLYHRRNDLLSCRKFAIEAYQVYLNSNDPIVKAESIIIRSLLECSETYPMENDSLRFFLDEARRLSQIDIDTMRCNYYDARYYAVKKDYPKYRDFRDKAISNERYYKRYYPEGDDVFAATEAAISGDWGLFEHLSNNLKSHSDLKYLSELCSSHGNDHLAYELSRRTSNLLMTSMVDNSKSRLDELSVKLGNVQLDNALTETTTKLQKTTQALFFIVLAFLIIVAASFVAYIYRNNKLSRKREALIKELRKARDEADRANKLKTSFVHNMSHEIRTPLNALVGFSQLLSLPEGYLTAKEKEDYSSYITNSSAVLTMLVDDILNTADIEAGNYKLNIEAANCTKICTFAGKNAEIRIQPGVELRYQMDIPSDFEVMSDPTRIQQVLIKMITNACKNTPSGSITVGCTTKEVPGFVTFFVADTGNGVPEDQADAIFERYTKLDQFKQGTGLGLSICRLIARLLQGDIYLDKSYKSGGARFVFNIPLEFDRSKISGKLPIKEL